MDAAPIVLEMAASPPPDPGLARALVAGCSAAAGPDGCVLGEEPPGRARAVVVVTFLADGARARVEVVARIGGGGALRREVIFRDQDPLMERFRATGMIAAGLVAETTSEPAEGPGGIRGGALVAAPPPRRPTGAVVLSLGGAASRTNRGWLGVDLRADLPAGASPVFVALSASYDGTASADALGISEARAAFGAGAGVRIPFAAAGIEVRLRAELELDPLRASIQQPGTGRQDAGVRLLTGVRSAADLLVPITDPVGAFVGARLEWLGADTAVRVGGSLAESIPAWAASAEVGLNLRLP